MHLVLALGPVNGARRDRGVVGASDPGGEVEIVGGEVFHDTDIANAIGERPDPSGGDLEDVDPQVRKKLKFVFVENAAQVLDHALGKRQIAQMARSNKKKA